MHIVLNIGAKAGSVISQWIGKLLIQVRLLALATHIRWIFILNHKCTSSRYLIETSLIWATHLVNVATSYLIVQKYNM